MSGEALLLVAVVVMIGILIDVILKNKGDNKIEQR